MSVVFKGADFSAPINFVGMYSDGTPMVKTDQWAEIVHRADTMILRADSIYEFTVGMYLVDAVHESHGHIETLILPYLPGARQDRSNPTGDVLFTAKSVANEINAREFQRVVSVDPHSPVMPSLIKNFEEYALSNIASKMWQGYTGIIAPDKGAKDRAQQFADTMGKPIYFGSKVRDVSTGALNGFHVETLPFGHYLVVDDICDGGGTFVGLGEKIREQGSFADLFVTHGLFSKGTEALKGIYKNITTTDTRPNIRNNNVLTVGIVAEMEN